jgi:hypothetical protein
MARDKLQVLLSMRRRVVEQARYALGACLDVESEAADKIRTLDDLVRRDRAIGAEWHDARHFREMSAIRMDAIRAERGAVLADLTAAEAASEHARGIVSTAWAATEAVERLIADRAVDCRAKLSVREQHVLDDISRSRRVVHRRSENS